MIGKKDILISASRRLLLTLTLLCCLLIPVRSEATYWYYDVSGLVYLGDHYMLPTEACGGMIISDVGYYYSDREYVYEVALFTIGIEGYFNIGIEGSLPAPHGISNLPNDRWHIGFLDGTHWSGDISFWYDEDGSPYPNTGPDGYADLAPWIRLCSPTETEFGSAPYDIGGGRAIHGVDLNLHRVAAVPEPSIILLLGLGLIGVAGIRNR